MFTVALLSRQSPVTCYDYADSTAGRYGAGFGFSVGDFTMTTRTRSTLRMPIAALALGLVGAVVLPGCTTANSSHPQQAGMYGHQHGGMMKRSPEQREAMRQQREAMVAQRLGLSVTQQQQIASLRQRYQPQQQMLRQQMKQVQQQIKAGRANGTPAANMLGLYQQQDNLREQMRQLRQQEKMQMNTILTPEQQVAWRQMPKGHGWHHGPKGKHGDMNPSGQAGQPMSGRPW